MKSPCLYCKSRYISCHSKCKSYLDYKNELELAKARKNKEADFMNYLCNSIERMKESRG